MDEGRNMILLFPTLIDFKSEEDRKNFAPTYGLLFPNLFSPSDFLFIKNNTLYIHCVLISNSILGATCFTADASSTFRMASPSGMVWTERAIWSRILRQTLSGSVRRRTRADVYYKHEGASCRDYQPKSTHIGTRLSCTQALSVPDQKVSLGIFYFHGPREYRKVYRYIYINAYITLSFLILLGTKEGNRLCSARRYIIGNESLTTSKFQVLAYFKEPPM